MKKSLFLLGAAVAAFASCTNEEVMDMPQNRAINFDGYVENNVRAVTEITTLQSSEFYVFGMYGASTGSYDAGVAHQNELGSQLHYWEPSSYYKFAAYADGSAGKLENVEFDAREGNLTITGYTPNDAKDLVAAISNEVATNTNVTSQSSVSLGFKHLLSQVAFEIKTEAIDVWELKISNLQIANAITTGTCVFDGTNDVWSSTNKGTITYAEFDSKDISAEATNSYKQSKLVIPQSGTDKLNVTFTATLKNKNDQNAEEKSQNFTATLAYSGTTPATANTWENGYRYKYTATINPDDIDDKLKNKEIKFEASIETWVNTTPEDTETTPTVVPEP